MNYPEPPHNHKSAREANSRSHRQIPDGNAVVHPPIDVSLSNAFSSVGKSQKQNRSVFYPKTLSSTRSKRSKLSQLSFSPRDLGDVNQKELTLSDKAGLISTKQRVSSWGLSVFVHAVIVLLLTLLFFPIPPSPPEVEAVFSTEIGDQLVFLTDDEGNLNPNQAEKYSLNVPKELKIEDVVIFEREKLPFVNDVPAPLFDQSRVEMSDMLAGRTDPGLKNDLISKYGGNNLTEKAVEAGLEWLVKQQNRDGSWSLCGPYTGGINSLDNKPAATALALLAFQGAGNTRSSGKHSAVVRRAWTWLLNRQNSDGSFAPSPRSTEALFYTQAICAIALCEMITLERNVNARAREQAKSAVNYILDNQHKERGGWKYIPQESSDLSVTGWCLMALKTAEMAGFDIPKTNYVRISNFLDSVSYDEGAGYVYQLNAGKIADGEKRPSMTATGLMCREYLGWEQNNPALLRGAKSLVSSENLILFPKTEEDKFYHNVYGWYSTSMALKGLGPYNLYWRRWNDAMSKEIPKRQEPQGSKEAGSWNPKYDEYSFGGGRLYVTCLSILCLEVYYRHLSIYR